MKKIVFFICCLLFCSQVFALNLDRQRVAEWADSFFTPRVQANVINGASIGVVQNGEIVFLKGYGWQDKALGIPLDPDTTGIRMCSVSKTFTATAILQLRDKGLITSLDDPVNKYLKRYQLPGEDGQKVTIRQLMTHSSGLAGHFTPQGSKDDLPVPLPAEQVAHMFRENLQRPPGVVGQYANLGVALEAVLIEDVTNMPLADVFKSAIFEPLNMTRSLLHHHIQKPENLAQPYGVFPNGELQAVPFFPKHPLTAASGGVIATPSDMLNYALFHADITSDTYAEVLANSSKREMQSRQFQNHPADVGMGLHFYPVTYGDTLFVSHGCGLPGTQSMFGVFPEHNAGIVISVLVADANPSVFDVVGKPFGFGKLLPPKQNPEASDIKYKNPWREFLTTFVGPVVLPSFDTQIDGLPTEQLVGAYWNERRSFRFMTSIFAANSVVQVKMIDKSTLQIRNRIARRVAAGVYDTEDAKRYIFRQVGDDIFLHTSPSVALRKTSSMAHPTYAIAGLGIWLVGLLTLVATPLWPRNTTVQKRIRRLGWTGLSAILALPVLLFAGYRGILDFALIDFANGDITRVVLIAIALNVIGLVGIAFIVASTQIWRGSSDWRDNLWRSHIVLLAICAVLSWPAYVVFNLIGLQL